MPILASVVRWRACGKGDVTVADDLERHAVHMGQEESYAVVLVHPVYDTPELLDFWQFMLCYLIDYTLSLHLSG